MKLDHRPLLAVLLALAAGAGAAQSPARSAETLRFGGKEYVRVADWARANGFEARWLKTEETLQLSNPSARLVFTVDSCEARINGVSVWLLAPVVNQGGLAYLAQIDLQETFPPLLRPPKNRPGARIKTICLDPGHGGKDPGNRVGSNEEKRYTLLLAQEVRAQLARAGLKATLTRGSDTFVELPDRPECARRRKADLFVSLHFNSAENGRDSVRGAEVYCLTPAGASSTNARGEGAGARCAGNRYNDQNLCLAYRVQKALTQGLAVEDRGVRRARFAVLRDAAMPAVLVEAGFMSHPVEGRKIFTSAYRREIARAIVEGVLAYKRLVERA